MGVIAYLQGGNLVGGEAEELDFGEVLDDEGDGVVLELVALETKLH
jgi:hypothetical protein